MENQVEHFDCTCHDFSHSVRFNLMTDEKYNECELYMSMYLNPERGFFSRLWAAIKYVLNMGRPCEYGHFGSWTLLPEDSRRLMALLRKHDKHPANNNEEN